MSKLIYRVTRKLEQALLRHTLSKCPRFGVHFIEAPPHGLGRGALPIETYHQKIASKYSSEMGGQLYTKNVSTDKELVRHTYAIPNSECAIPGVSIYHGHTLRHTSQAIRPQGQNGVLGKTPRSCSEVIRLCMD